MERFWQMVKGGDSGAPADPGAAKKTAGALAQIVGAHVYPESLAAQDGAMLAIARRGIQQTLLVAWPAGQTPAIAVRFEGDQKKLDLPVGLATVLEGPRVPANAAALRETLPFTAPRSLDGRPSIGLGDRLGLATPGHVRAVRGTGFVPILAQQSIREMTRTNRSPQQVIDDATWGVFQTGFRDGFGADADHLKSTDDIDRCAAVGFTFYTIDPGDHVDPQADDARPAALQKKFAALPWDALETTPDDARRRYAGLSAMLANGSALAMDDVALHRAAAKYGAAVAHTAALYRHLVGALGQANFELEVSVDETETPTTPPEHYYVAAELARLGVRWVSLAPRFVGRFEKGVDYIGDLGKWERSFVTHLAISEKFGGYKISLHSGSDKFSVYQAAARHGGRRVHVKTAGTSYLEALRTVAGRQPDLFREILDFARSRYGEDKATYHVSADLAKVPAADELPDDALPSLLDQFDARQVLHVTFGSVLSWDDGERFRHRLLDALKTHEDAYADALNRHIGRHIAPFLKGK